MVLQTANVMLTKTGKHLGQPYKILRGEFGARLLVGLGWAAKCVPCCFVLSVVRRAMAGVRFPVRHDLQRGPSDRGEGGWDPR